jgi:hypothetical protein
MLKNTLERAKEGLGKQSWALGDGTAGQQWEEALRGRPRRVDVELVVEHGGRRCRCRGMMRGE